MRQPFRLPSGGRIDRGRRVVFSFDGRSLAGFAGDSLAAAIMAHGVRLVGRSFKYHRPRGIFSAGPEEPNALLRVELGPGRIEPQARATMVELVPGLGAATLSGWPSVRRDLFASFDRAAAFLPAGFYYKTFFRPRGAWERVFEPAIRRLAGLGRAPERPDPDRYLHRHAHCDLLVVGGGPAGLAAARAAARAGARVILCDERPFLGGGLAMAGTCAPRIDDSPAESWVVATIAELERAPEVTLLARTTAIALHPSRHALLVERVADHRLEPDPRLPRERLWKVRPRAVLLATGRIERPLLFPDNDRPGVMLAGAARAHLARSAVLAGRDLVIATADDSAYAAALELAAAGVRIRAIADARLEPGALASAAEAAGLRVLPGWTVVGTEGRLGIRAATLARLGANGAPIEASARTLACDALLVSGGWTPAVQLWAQAGGRLAFDDARAAFLPDGPCDGVRVAGAAAGATTLGEALATARGAVAELLARLGFAIGPETGPAIDEPRPAASRPPWTLEGVWRRRPERSFVDLQNDVTAFDLGLALQEGFRAVEHVKRYTTWGMATDQGRTSGPLGLGVIAALGGRPLATLAPTTFRPPTSPVSFGALAGVHRGDLFRPIRTTPLHDWCARQGALFEDVGLWKRPTAFPRRGESLEAAVERECRTVREAVGLLDASTLAKIDVQGKDAAAFLDRIWTIDVADLPIGRARYGLVLEEDGTILDDGIVCRLGERRFLLFGTTNGAARLYAWLERWAQTEWPELEVWITPVTEQWATLALQGPKSRLLLLRAATGVDLGPREFPHMALREGTIAGIPARLRRASFSGELGFEIDVPPSRAQEVAEALAFFGRDLGLAPYGLEAMHVLRLEKGYILVGHETDGTVTPLDLGLDRLLSKKKDFLGRRSLALPEHRCPERPRLVGLLPEDPHRLPEPGAQLVAEPVPQAGTKALGHVTSSARSATLARTIALGLVRGDHATPGTTLFATSAGATVEVALAAPCFYDPEGARLRG
ncbi:MAG: sarcosine oxidase subunit alpha family protein [Geminicoccaceae bacterium]|nr:sarcosine oxidase subunit alpha family protein [Geminicoccaceae bacterium]